MTDRRNRSSVASRCPMPWGVWVVFLAVGNAAAVEPFRIDIVDNDNAVSPRP